MTARSALLLFVLLLPAPVLADSAPGFAVVRIPVDVPAPFPVRDFGPDLEPACTAVYLNESFSSGFYAAMPANVELADDLHTTLATPQLLCGFDFAYYKPGAGLVDATVTFYGNAPDDAARGAVLAGPYVVPGLPAGIHAFHIEVPGGVLDRDVWMGVAFADGVSGLLCFGPPTLGTTHDRVWITPPDVPGGFGADFGGNPPANLFLGVSTSPATPAAPATWGRVKVLYR